MMGEVFKQFDVGKGEVVCEEGYYFYVDFVSGLCGYRYGDDVRIFFIYCLIVVVVNN